MVVPHNGDIMNDIKELITSVLKNTTYNNVNVYELSKKLYDVLSSNIEDFKNRLSEENVFEILSNIIEENNLNAKEEKTLSQVDQLINEYQDVRINPLIGNPVIDLYSEMKNELLSGYRDVGDAISSCKIVISNPEIMKYAGDLMSIINEGNSKIYRSIAVIADNIVSSFNDIENLDSEINDVDLDDLDFNDWEKVKQRIPSSVFKEVDEKFFTQCGYQVNNNIVTIGEYKYDIKYHKFYYDKTEIGGVYISVPDGVSDYSKLNTVTMLTGKDERKQDVSIAGNAIVVSFDDADSSYCKMPKNIAAITKFVNSAANTNLSRCQNIITGGSRLGARSLKIAADTDDLYQTVICVNNAILVKGENSDGKKESFENLEQLQKLNGKNIYFISTRKDSNIYRTIGNKDTQVSNAYLYTGIELAMENCPDSQIYLVENNGDSAFKELQGSNYHYRPDLWDVITKDIEKKYDEHGYYNNILNDLCSSNLVGYNGYTDMNADTQYKAQTNIEIFDM